MKFNPSLAIAVRPLLQRYANVVITEEKESADTLDDFTMELAKAKHRARKADLKAGASALSLAAGGRRVR